jgi:hypothetical protein
VVTLGPARIPAARSALDLPLETGIFLFFSVTDRWLLSLHLGQLSPRYTFGDICCPGCDLEGVLSCPMCSRWLAFKVAHARAQRLLGLQLTQIHTHNLSGDE